MTLALPVIDRPLDNTAMSLFMRCPRKYDFAMRRHRRGSGNTNSPALAYGSAWHTMMELHYKFGGDSDIVYMGLEKHWQDHGKLDDHRTKERAWLEYQKYVEKYGPPDQEEAKTVGFPDNPLVEISANVTWDGAPHAYAGKIDRIIELQGQYYVEDHKTTSRMGDYYFKQFELSNQMMGYVWIARKLIPGIKIAGVRINAHCVLKRESKFARNVISFSDDRLEEWAENYADWIARLQHCYAEDNFPGNYSECDGKYRICEYATVCSMPPRLRERVLESEFEINPWNPLDATEEGEDAAEW
jgi:hypothetical protein